MTKDELKARAIKQEKEARIMEMLKYDMPLSRDLTAKDVIKLTSLIAIVSTIFFTFIGWR